MWEETLVFNVGMPEIALVRFLVWDHDPIGRDFIGQRTIAFTSMMPGKIDLFVQPRGFFIFILFFLSPAFPLRYSDSENLPVKVGTKQTIKREILAGCAPKSFFPSGEEKNLAWKTLERHLASWSFERLALVEAAGKGPRISSRFLSPRSSCQS